MGNCCATTLSYLRNEHNDVGKAQYRPSKRELEFEDLLKSDRKQKKNQQKGILTEEEIKMLEEGKINELVDHQTAVDAKIDAQLAKEEEKLRLEEQWSAAKRAVAKKAKKKEQQQELQHHKVQVEIESSLTDPATAQVKDSSHVLGTEDKTSSTNQMQSPDEDDFDQFLENVKARSLSTQKQAPDGGTSNNEEKKEETEEDVDFGYWESAILEDKPSSTSSKSQPTASSTAQDVDLL